MSVKVRRYRNGGWEVDITFRLPNGKKHRERSKAPVDSKSGALRWGQDRERHLLQHGPPQSRKQVPTIEQFAPRFLEGHALANQQKPSELAAKESILRVHLIPLFGEKRLDEITTEQVQRLKQRLQDRAPKTVNNALTVLQTMLKKAVEWNVIDRMPCVIRWVRTPKPSVEFYDFPEYERFVTAARAIDSNKLPVERCGIRHVMRTAEAATKQGAGQPLAGMNPWRSLSETSSRTLSKAEMVDKDSDKDSDKGAPAANTLNRHD